MAEALAQERESRRPTGKRRLLPRVRITRRRAMAGTAAGAAVLCGAGLLMSMQSPLGIGAVDVAGASPELEPAVVSALGVQPGDTFSSVSTAEAEQRINEIDGVAGVDLRWTWWNRLTVRVQEQTPAAVIAGPKGAFIVIDPSGATIRTVSARPAGLPLLDFPSGAAGQAAALAVARQLQPGALGGVDAVVATSARAVELHLVSGVRVVLGPPEDLAEKMLLAQQLSPTDAEVIDVTVPRRPALSGLPEPD